MTGSTKRREARAMVLLFPLATSITQLSSSVIRVALTRVTISVEVTHSLRLWRIPIRSSRVAMIGMSKSWV